MPSKTSQARKRLAKKGFRGYPVGTLAFYGPDDRRATKMVASIVEGEEGIDYEGPTCPQCQFWAIRDRWSGEVIQ